MRKLVWWVVNRYFPDSAPFFLRVALGTVFMAHGWAKMQGPLGTPEGFNIDSWGWPYPVLWVWAVASIEFFGGLLVIVGLFTRFAAASIAGVMALAILKVKLNQGFVGGFELELTLLMIAFTLVIIGGGKFSVDYEILGWGAPPRRRADREKER